MAHVVTKVGPPIPSKSGALEVHLVPAAQDNLVWLLVHSATRHAAAVDGPDARPVLDYCEAQGLELTCILNTHTHPDHIGINRELAELGLLGGLRVVGAEATRDAIPGITETVEDGSMVDFEGIRGEVMLTEGHIDGHISYLFDDLLFCGDTLFGAGCGYLFDGPPAKMHASLKRLAALDGATRVFCAHEYTEDNLLFAHFVEPHNPALARRIDEVRALRRRGECSLPSTIAEELETNPFIRTGSEELRATLAREAEETSTDSDVSVFAATRALKDSRTYKNTSFDRRS